MREKIELDFHFGALAEPLEKQLKDKDITLKNAEKYDLCMKSISALYIHGFMIDSERERIYKRFLTSFKRDVFESLNEVE